MKYSYNFHYFILVCLNERFAKVSSPQNAKVDICLKNYSPIVISAIRYGHFCAKMFLVYLINKSVK